MRIWTIVAVVAVMAPGAVSGQANCLDPASLIRLDAEWEDALLTRDAEWLELHLADDFVWVHNHASLIDTKPVILQRANTESTASQTTRSRIQSGVEARVAGSTGIVTGYTVVDRGPSPTRFHFMRAYALLDGSCRLLGNHTMQVPPPGDRDGGAS